MVNHDGLDDLVREHEKVLTHAQLVEAGVPLSTICRRILRSRDDSVTCFIATTWNMRTA